MSFRSYEQGKKESMVTIGRAHFIDVLFNH